ncbi:MAG: UDP-N-acetylmuramoyl-tripeptide--D-alanyl-D-alanine ligase [Parachlamydiaceae bacterium]|nr:UDP-N-acetylmuramoyl-tripeptide--D-alanyl-D-alanine ligase [Parachlamydiaceae bacterium]
MELMTLQQIAKILNTTTTSSINPTGVCVDSRLIKNGNLFFALKGDKTDGHQFLENVAKGGAVAAVVSKDYIGPHYNLPLIFVDDTLKALQKLAKETLAKRRVRIIAVTGSIGKTTTKDFLNALLSVKYKVAASPGNSNSQIGLPLAILNHTTGQEEILIFEMGMTHHGQISQLVEIAPPEVALITNVALVHACNFDSLEDIAKAKSEIFSSPQTRFGVIPFEIPNHGDLVHKFKACPKVSFSIQNANSDYYINPNIPNEVHIKLESSNAKIPSLKVPGKHNLYNLLAAATVARYFGVSWEEISSVIPSLALPERRLQLVNHKGISFLNDSYNASELSVKAALQTLPAPTNNGKKIAVLGSMMELGKFSNDCHSRVGEFALDQVDQVYCLGDECQPIFNIFSKAGKPTGIFTKRADLVDHLKTILKPNDVVLLKGSRSKELWKVLEEL